MSLFVAGAIFGEVVVMLEWSFSCLVAVFGVVAVSLFVAGVILECYLSWHVQHFVTWDDFFER